MNLTEQFLYSSEPEFFIAHVLSLQLRHYKQKHTVQRVKTRVLRRYRLMNLIQDVRMSHFDVPVHHLLPKRQSITWRQTKLPPRGIEMEQPEINAQDVDGTEMQNAAECVPFFYNGSFSQISSSTNKITRKVAQSNPAPGETSFKCLTHVMVLHRRSSLFSNGVNRYKRIRRRCLFPCEEVLKSASIEKKMPMVKPGIQRIIYFIFNFVGHFISRQKCAMS